MYLISVFVVLIFLHSLLSSRMERTVVTAPIVFTTAGALALFFLPASPDREGGQHFFLSIAELGLVLLLFSDAYRTDLRALRSFRSLPVRLLSIGMLLTILLGLLWALAVLPGLSLWEAGILAAILAPTDAGLGQIIVNSPRVPMKIRQALNVEAGLNDGLSVPFLLFFIALAGGGAETGHSSLIKYIVEQLGYGALVGLGIGFVGGRLLGEAHRRRWTGHMWLQLGTLALPLLCLLASEAVHASMFIAAFIGGMAAQAGFKSGGEADAIEFTEHAGQLFNLSVFFLFGLLVARVWDQLDARHLLYAALSLTVVRMLPVVISLIGTRLSAATILFMGWFGPRGLASIVLGLVYLEHASPQPGEATIRLAVMATVLCSIFAHGLSALPGMKLYARHLATLPQDAPEFDAPEAETLEAEVVVQH
ncbi:MAG TPA: cation:proton antiporter [Pyrinomonadaceae bacterium]|nr:cation:proton antiporter [Pyrinomonadaceae bacterium]